MEHAHHLVNGSAVLALAGRECVLIASDTQFGNKTRLISSEVPKVFHFKSKVLLGFAGLYSDALSLFESLKFRVNMYELSCHKEASADVIVAMTSKLLYEKRFGNYLIEAIICSLVGDKPFICLLDCYGYPSHYGDYIASGTCKNSLMGLCELFWKPDLSETEAIDVACQALINATARDVFTGSEVIVYMVTKDHLVCRTLKARSD